MMVQLILIIFLALSIGPAFSAEKSKIEAHFANKADGIYYNENGDPFQSKRLQFDKCKKELKSCLTNEGRYMKSSRPKYNVRGKFFVVFNGTAKDHSNRLTGLSVLKGRTTGNAALLIKLTTTTKGDSIPKLDSNIRFISLERKEITNNCFKGNLQKAHSQQKFMSRFDYFNGTHGQKSTHRTNMKKFHFDYRETNEKKCQYTLEHVVNNQNIELDDTANNHDRKAIAFLGKPKLSQRFPLPSKYATLADSLSGVNPAYAYEVKEYLSANDTNNDSELAALIYLNSSDKYFSFSTPIVTVPLDTTIYSPKDNKRVFTSRGFLWGVFSNTEVKNQFLNEKYSDEIWTPKTSVLTLQPINSLNITGAATANLSKYKIFWAN